MHLFRVAYSENQNQLKLWGRHFLGQLNNSSSSSSNNNDNNPGGGFNGMISPAASLR